MTAPEKTVQASERAAEVVDAFRVLRGEDHNQDNVKHLWSLAESMVSDIHRGEDNYPRTK